MPRKWFSQGWRHAHQAPGLSYIDSFNVSGSIITNTKELMIVVHFRGKRRRLS